MQIAGINFTLPFTIEAWAIYEVFLLDAFTYFLVILFFIFMKYDSVAKEKIDIGSLISRFKQGFNYLYKKPIIFVFGVASYMLFAFTLVQIHVVLPSYVNNFLNMGADVYASSEIYYSIGAIFSGVLILRIFKNLSTVSSVIILMFTVSLAFFLMAIYKILWVFFIGSLILGVTNAGVRILRTTYIFNHVPNNLIGRTNSVFNSLNIMIRMILIGMFALQFFHSDDNIRYAYFIGSALILLAIIVLLLWYKMILSSERG